MKALVATFKHFRGFYYMREFDTIAEFKAELADDVSSEVCWAVVVSSEGEAVAKYSRGVGVSF